MLRSWILAARPKTLSAAVVPVMMGAALAPRPLRWDLVAFALAGALFIQIGTNLVNDALDYKKGADTGERLGPIRVTQAGLLTPRAVLNGAIACFFLACLCGVPLIVRGGWPLLIIGLASIGAAYAYTGGPYPLAYHGLGELFVLIFFGLVAVGGTYYLQALTIDWTVIAAGIAAGSLAVVLLVINNLRDIPGDRASGKRTLAARFGERFARAEIALFAIVPFLAVSGIAFARNRWWLGASLLALPVALIVIRCAFRHEGRALNRCLALAGGFQWLFGVLFVVGALL